MSPRHALALVCAIAITCAVAISTLGPKAAGVTIAALSAAYLLFELVRAIRADRRAR